jgi:hypothetical protein
VSQLEVFTSVMTFSNLGYDENSIFSFHATIFSPLLTDHDDSDVCANTLFKVKVLEIMLLICIIDKVDKISMANIQLVYPNICL